jgi:hypothetical protein
MVLVLVLVLVVMVAEGWEAGIVPSSPFPSPINLICSITSLPSSLFASPHAGTADAGI